VSDIGFQGLDKFRENWEVACKLGEARLDDEIAEANLLLNTPRR
jgi:hypothetical protein